MTNRWHQWFSEENLRADPRILAAPHSRAAESAAAAFLSRDQRLILDLACGVGRDAFYLGGRGLAVIGVDSSPNGLGVASLRNSAQDTVPAWIAADARRLAFRDGSFDGAYCFGLLHEFTGERKEQDVAEVMSEIGRTVRPQGILVLAVLAGDPADGLPAIQRFSREMFDNATRGWRRIEIKLCDDIGCTNRPDYHVWYGMFEK